MPAFLQNLYTKADHHYRRLTFKPYVIKRQIAGQQFDFFIADPVAKEWYDTGATVWPEMDYIKNHVIVPGDIILECGSHHGITTAHLARSTGPTGQVVAFEPSPFNCKVIQKNADLNHLPNIKVINKAIGPAVGKANFSFVSNASLQKGSLGTFEIDVTTIDSFKDLKPTVLKLDVEGYDVEALMGAQEVLKTRPKLLIEVHHAQLPNFGHSVQDVFDQLDLTDYDCMLMTDGSGKFQPLGAISDIKKNVHLFGMPKEQLGSLA